MQLMLSTLLLLGVGALFAPLLQFGLLPSAHAEDEVTKKTPAVIGTIATPSLTPEEAEKLKRDLDNLQNARKKQQQYLDDLEKEP